jgi:GNAT superfamily N-acetyltransferase
VTDTDRASRVAARFHVAWLTLLAEQPGNPAGVDVRWLADDLVATRATNEPEVRWLQQVSGFAERHAPLLDEILEWYRGQSLPFRFEAVDRAAVSAAVERGGVEADPIDVLAGSSFSFPPGRPWSGVDIDEVEPAEATDFAALHLAGHEVVDPPPAHLAAVAGFVGAPGWRCFVASVEGRPAGVGVLVVDDGVGYLANASTTPAARGRGVQSALITVRLLAAAEDGCDLFTSLAIPGTPSHRNLERAGLRPIEHRRFVHVS